MKILLVDDSVATLDTFGTLFELRGWVTFPAANAAAAFAHLEQRPEIDLLITDHFLPGETGLDLCARARRSGRKLPIFLLTAADAETVEGLRRKCALLPGVTVLRKPVDPAALLEMIVALQAGGGDSTILRRMSTVEEG